MDNFANVVNHYWREFNKIPQKGKLVILGVLAASFVAGFAVPYVLNNYSNYKPAKAPAIPTPIPLPAVISLSSDKSLVAVGSTFSATVNINSPNQGVEAADFVVNFDPDYLKVATVSSGNYFGLYPVKEVEIGQVKISGIANLVDNKFIIPIGKGNISKIVFETLSATPSTQISFDRIKTIVASKGQNILDPGKITDLEIMIK